MLEINDIDKYSKILKIDRYTVLREYVQLVFLNQLFRIPRSNKLTFKGGTALRIIYGSARFSEDLDFNSKLGIGMLAKLLTDVLDKMRLVLPSIYMKEITTIQGYSAKLFLNTEITPFPLSIKLDFSMRETTLSSFEQSVNSILPVPSYSLIRAMETKEILAEKIRTLFQRTKGRDLYDIWYLLTKKTELDLSIVNSKMKLIEKHFDKSEVFEKIHSFDNKKIENDLFKFLPLHERGIIPKLKELVVTNQVWK